MSLIDGTQVRAAHSSTDVLWGMLHTPESTMLKCSSMYIMRLLACAHAACAHAAGHAAASRQLAALDVAALAAHTLDHAAGVCVQTSGSR